MLSTLLLAAAIGVPPCWNIFDAALRHSAMASHPAFVTYDERISIREDDARLLQSVAHIEYRDDGLALVRDERFGFAPVLTRYAEPGPPELGPYGQKRQSWLPQAQLLPTIAAVRAQGDMSCRDDGTETYKGHTTYHLQFAEQRHDRPALKALWVDTTTHDIWKLIISGYVLFADDPGAPPGLADFEVELGYVGPYLMVNHVVWAYDRHEYSQTSQYFAEYTFGGFQFPKSLPASDFSTAAALGP